MCSASCASGDSYNSIAGACSSAVDKSFYQPCPVCFGDPIYPLTGAKRQELDLGVRVGNTPVKIAYDTTTLLPEAGYNPPWQVTTPASFGSLWQTNVHKTLALQATTTDPGSAVGSQWSAVAMQRGSAAIETASVPGASTCGDSGSGGNSYAPTTNLNETLTMTGTGSAGRLVDQRGLDEETYDATGLITSQANAAGGTLTFAYTSGFLSSVTDQFGREVQFGYEQPADMTLPKRINLVTAPDGTQIQAAYNSGNMLSTLTWADGAVETFIYDSPTSPQLMTGILDENSARYSTTTYDAQGRAQSTFQGAGVDMYSVSYTTPPTWQVTITPLNASYVCREHRFIGPAGTMVQRPTGQTDTLNATSVNGSVYLGSITQAAGSGSAASVSSSAYDAAGNVISSDDFNGNRSCFAYDTSRNLQTISLEGLAGASSATPKACPSNLAGYSPSPADAAHPERKTTTVWHPDWVLKAREAEPKKITTWVYNGQPDPIGGGTASCAPAAAPLPDGKPIAVLCARYEQATTDATGALGISATVTGATRKWSFTYNQFGQVLTATTPKQSSTDSLSHTTTYTYYSDTSLSGGVGHTIGDLQTVTNPVGQVTTFSSYDGGGRLLSSTDANGTVTTQSYWPRGWLKAQTVTTAGSSATSQTTSYAYWPTGSLKTVTMADGSTLSYGYDAAHRLTDITDAAGNKIHYVLDNSGNRTSEQVSDASGHLASTISRVFDTLNRVQTQTGVLH